MSITKTNKSTKYFDYEKIFLEEFKKMLNGGIIVRKKNKLIGHTFYQIKTEKSNKELILTNITNNKSINIDICEIKNIQLIDNTKIKIQENELIEFEMYNDNIGNIFKDGLLLLRKERIQSRKIFNKLLEEVMDTESERESFDSRKSFTQIEMLN